MKPFFGDKILNNVRIPARIGPRSHLFLNADLLPAIRTTALLIVYLLIQSGCRAPQSTESSNPRSGKPQVIVVNYPLEYFTRRIAGDSVEVIFPFSNERDPGRWQPKTETVAKMQTADLILLNGASFSKWLVSVSLPESKLVDTSQAFRQKLIRLNDSFVHQHGPKGSQSDQELASMTWLDLQLAKQQATAIKEAIANLLPGHKSQLSENLEKLTAELDDLDQQFIAAAKRIQSVPLISSRPVYQYLARRYPLKLDSMNWKPQAVPDEKELSQLRDLLKQHPARAMIWPEEPADEIKKILEDQFQIRSYVVRLQASQVDAPADWLESMKENLHTIQSIDSDQNGK